MKWAKWLIIGIFAALLFSGLLNPVLDHLSDKNWLTHYLASHGWQGHGIVLLAATVFLMLGGPRQAVAFSFGYLYGVSVGVALSIGVCLSGALVNYVAAKMLLADFLMARFPIRMRKFDEFARRAPFMKILTLRLLPVGSNLVTNLLSGSVRVPLFAFLSASALGYLPQTFVFSLVGGGINTANHTMLYLSIGLSLISFVLTGLIYRDHLKQKLSKLNVESRL